MTCSDSPAAGADDQFRDFGSGEASDERGAFGGGNDFFLQ